MRHGVQRLELVYLAGVAAVLSFDEVVPMYPSNDLGSGWCALSCKRARLSWRNSGS